MPADELAGLALLLSPDEKARAARFHSAAHACRFVAAHARLRQQLAALLSVEPGEIRFAAGPHGKPGLAAEFAETGLEFNLSHSGPMALIGWAWRRAIGVDIELWRRTSDEAALVRRYFSACEIAAYEALEPEQRLHSFFDCWTRKEAYVKAVGRGLGLPLDSFDVTLGPASEARLLRTSAVHDDGRSWSLAAVHLETDASAAVVMEGDAFHILPQH